jgi:CheY-like chemotaxis protein
MMTVAERAIQRVAIVDDNPSHAQAMGELVLDAGFEPVVLRPPFGQVDELLGRVRQQADAAICDHRLWGLARFSGAEAVATLVEEKVPALLVTQYIDIDADVSIRRWRYHIPVLLSRDDADSDRIKSGLGDCMREIQGEYLPGRRPWRVLIQIEWLTEESGDRVVDARVPSWRPNTVVRFPLDLVPCALRDGVVQGAFLLAMVNIGAEKGEDLFFQDFEAAPDPAPEESLG